MNAICNYDILGEGIDIPILAGVIIRRLTCSLINWLQWVGRSLRLAPSKKQAIIIDQAGNIFDHGHPQEIREWSLDGSNKLKNKDDILMRQCPACGCWNIKTNKICIGCGEDLSRVMPDKKLNIKVINEPLIEIKPPELPTGREAIDKAELLTYSENDIDSEIIDRIKNISAAHEPDCRERLEMLAMAYGKNKKWTEEAWRMING